MSTINIVKGSTYRDTLRWASSLCLLKACTVVATAPVRISCTAHGVVDGWNVQIENHVNFNPKTFYAVKVIDANTLEISCVNGAAFKAGAAVLRYNAPVDMAGYTARMKIKDKVGGTVLAELTTANGRIVIDNVAKTIVREIPADVTAALAAKKGVFDLEMIQGTYVTKIDSGTVTIANEVTT